MDQANNQQKRTQAVPPGHAEQAQAEVAEAHLQVLREMVEAHRRDRARPAPVQPANSRHPSSMRLAIWRLVIQQFVDIMDANEWTPAAPVLYLRTCLEKEAGECG